MIDSMNDNNGMDSPKPLAEKPDVPANQASLFTNSTGKSKPRKHRQGELNDLQRAQLQDCLKAGATVKIGQVPDSMKRSCSDTPLFAQQVDKMKLELFEQQQPKKAPGKKPENSQISQKSPVQESKQAPGIPRYMLVKDHNTSEWTVWDNIQSEEVGRGTHQEMKDLIETL